MATRGALVAELMAEAGINPTSPVRQQFETHVGDVTVDLLSQSMGKFFGLKKTYEFTLTASDRKVKLPTDFNSAAELYEVDSDGRFKAWGAVRDRADVFENMVEEAYSGYRQGWIEELSGSAAPDGNGLYLVLGEEPDETAYMILDYYRRATADDTDLIRKPTFVKDGVRSRMAQYWPDPKWAIMYEREKSGFREDRAKRRTAQIFMPSRRIARHNVRMARYGKPRG